MLKITPTQAINAWCVYTLATEAGEIIFIWYSKLASALSINDALSNPFFDVNKNYIFNITTLCNCQQEALKFINGWMKHYNYYPTLNQTISNRYFRRIICNETGQIFRSQLEAAKTLGINQSQLSQHLRRTPGYKSIKGLTFSNLANHQTQIQRIQFPPPMPS